MSIRVVNLAIEIKNIAEGIEVSALGVPSSDVLAAANLLQRKADELTWAAASEAQADRLRSQ